MKKIMIALAAVAMAAVSQAAVVQWKSGALTDATGAGVTKANAITAYMFAIDATAFDAYAAMDAATLSQTVGAAYVAGELGTAQVSKGNTYSSRGGAAADLVGTTQYSAGDTAYGLILYVDETADMYLANVAKATFASTQNEPVTNLANILGGGTSGTATAWAAAVPEPTSGLLLLLGMAGLALKRKRA